MMTIPASFQQLLAQIEPPESVVAAADGRLRAIRVRLGQAFNLSKLEKIGSFSRDTFIRGASDIDALAVISRDDVRWGDGYKSSSTVLDHLRRELEGRFPNTTVYRDVHAVVVGFVDCSVDVVPAVFSRTTPKGWPVYHMPDGAGDWMETSPGLHNAYIRQQDSASGGKIRGTARLLKFWRECRSPRIPISSFHIEMILASEEICRGVKSYAQCVADILQNLSQRSCRALQDPLGVSGYIAAVKTESQGQLTLASVRNSWDHASAAVHADSCRDPSEARRQWDIVFNGQFPW